MKRKTATLEFRMATRDELAAGALARLRYLFRLRRRDADKMNPAGLALVGHAIVTFYNQAKRAGAGDEAAALVLEHCGPGVVKISRRAK
jgi:hypothetical protein